MGIKKTKVEMFKLKCEVCGHRWESRQKPLRCAKCKTPYWDIRKSATPNQSEQRA